jgi:cytochrome c oxidase subunit 5b
VLFESGLLSRSQRHATTRGVDPPQLGEATLITVINTGTLDNPITVKSFGDEQYLGCTGYPADSHVVIWLTTSRDRPIERCPECGSVYKMDYVGPQESHDDHGHGHGEHDIHESSDGAHNYEAEPQTMADFIRPEYR